ncbi:hypothetical protein F2Q69_00055343 [Brassica cretica]|uniref:Uncharacterized protein n=1 Tax=Brassica cretica TaxID=69181 RepID=A0A8S9N8L0_BRACR|nr:hypothetical protein F2Q69_00055343 [Brassica cretica]
MNETEATCVPDDSAPVTSISADATEHKPVGVIESVEDVGDGLHPSTRPIE